MVERIPATERKSTGYFACNGMMHIGDCVIYDDGWLCLHTNIEERDGLIGFAWGDEFLDLAGFIKDFSLWGTKKLHCAEIDFTIIENVDGEDIEKKTMEQMKIPDCPVCGKTACIKDDSNGFYIECSPGCKAPRCYHLDYHETMAAWTDFVYFFESFYEGCWEYIPLTHHDLVMSSGEKILISHDELGTWEDTSQGIYTFMDIDDLMISDDQNLDMAQFGRTWLAFRRMSQSEIDERNRPVNLLSKRRALKHCIEVLAQLREHKPRAFYNDPQLCDILQQMEGAVAGTDELLDKLLWA